MATSKDIEEQIQKLQYAQTWQERREAIMTLQEWGVHAPIVVQPLIDAA